MLASVGRLLQLLLVLAWHGGGILAGRLLATHRRRSGPQRLRILLERVGGTFLKFGQVLALQPDVIPREYCNALFDLLDRVPSFAYAQVETTFLEELGKRPAEIFDSFEPRPIASASIGQVHVAWLQGRKLAVKVRRPRVEQIFSTDLRIMRMVAAVIRRLHLSRLYWLDRGIREFASWTREELDYRYEARFMSALAYNARSNSNEAVPVVLGELTTARILVAEFLDGPMVLSVIRRIEGVLDPQLDDRLQELAFDPERLARNIVQNFVSDAFHHGLFHADLHPANLLILRDNVVGYVDFGITGSLSHYSRRNLVALTLALTRGDTDAILRSFMRIATTDPGADEAAFRRGLREMVGNWYEQAGDDESCLRSSFTMVMLDMLQLSRDNGVWPTPDVIRYIRSVITADGLITRFAPQLDVGSYLEEVCEEYLRQEMWQEWLSAEYLADWASTGVRLLGSGPAAVAAVLQQLDDGERPAATGCHDDDGSRQRWQPLQFGVIALGSALLTLAEIPQLGLNLFTAELALTTAAATMLVVNLRRSG